MNCYAVGLIVSYGHLQFWAVGGLQPYKGSSHPRCCPLTFNWTQLAPRSEFRYFVHVHPQPARPKAGSRFEVSELLRREPVMAPLCGIAHVQCCPPPFVDGQSY